MQKGKKDKKALIVTTVSGFVPQFEMGNVSTLQEMGYEVHYASNFNNVNYGSDNHRLDGTGIIRHQVDFVRSPFQLKSNYKAYQQLKRVMKKEHFDMVHCHTPMGAVLGRLVAKPYRKKGTKVIYTAHGFHFYKGAPLKNWLLFYPVERWLANYTDVLIVINEEDYKQAKKFCKYKDVYVKKIPGVGVNIEYFNKMGLDKEEFQKNRKRIREKLNIKEDKFLMISVGELNKNKNHILVIKALANCDENVYYIICGEGKERTFLEQEIKKLELENRVRLLGYCKDVKQLLNASDVFVMSSLREGLSCSIQEAMAASLPVIASDIRGNRELVNVTKGGRLINPRSVEDMKCAIEDIQKEDKEVLGRYNFHKIQNYSDSVVTMKMKNIYQTVLKEKVNDR